MAQPALNPFFPRNPVFLRNPLFTQRLLGREKLFSLSFYCQGESWFSAFSIWERTPDQHLIWTFPAFIASTWSKLFQRSLSRGKLIFSFFNMGTYTWSTSDLDFSSVYSGHLIWTFPAFIFKGRIDFQLFQKENGPDQHLIWTSLQREKLIFSCFNGKTYTRSTPAQLNSTEFKSTHLNSTQLSSIRSTQLNSTQTNSTQLNSTQLKSTQLNSAQLNSINSTQRNSIQLKAIPINST